MRGGFTDDANGKAINNLVIITDSQIQGDAFGATLYNTECSADNNTVIVSGSTFNNKLGCADIPNSYSKAQNNTLILVGKGATYLNPITMKPKLRCPRMKNPCNLTSVNSTASMTTANPW